MCAGMGPTCHILMAGPKWCWVGPKAIAQTAQLQDCLLQKITDTIKTELHFCITQSKAQLKSIQLLNILMFMLSYFCPCHQVTEDECWKSVVYIRLTGLTEEVYHYYRWIFMWRICPSATPQPMLTCQDAESLF